VPAEIDIFTLEDAQAAGTVALIDVRQPDEYVDGHVPGAVLVPLNDLPDRLADLPPERPLYVICRTGARSSAAVEFLQEMQVEAINIAGGTKAWVEAGNDIVVGPDPT
jgi:rhodanese-related sulfurtransferase